MVRHRYERAVIVVLAGVVCGLVVWGMDGVPKGVATTSTTDAGHLAADEVGSTLSVSGHLGGPLAPGRGESIDIRLANLTARSVRIDVVRVSIDSVRGPGGRRSGCGPDDFTLRQGDLIDGVRVPAGAQVLLSQTGLDRSRWPRLEMVDHPHNQDGCKGAVVRLAFEAAGSAT